jgi:hypothetical protein
VLEPRDALDVVRADTVDAAGRPRPTASIHENDVIEATPRAHDRGGFAAPLADLEGAIVAGQEPPRDGPAGPVVPLVQNRSIWSMAGAGHDLFCGDGWAGAKN